MSDPESDLVDVGYDDGLIYTVNWVDWVGDDPVVVAQRDELAAGLARWVVWLVTRYRIPSKTIPPCWFLHGAHVEELSALWTAWQATFNPDADPKGPVWWHEALARALQGGDRNTDERRHWPGVEETALTRFHAVEVLDTVC